MGKGNSAGMRSLGLAALLAALPMGSCMFGTDAPPKPSEADGPIHRLDYVVRVGNGAKECRIEIRLLSWPQGTPKILQAPLFYTDNPAMPVSGFTAADLEVRTRSGRILAAKDTLLPLPELDGNFIVLPPSAVTVSYLVDLDPVDDSRFGLPIESVGEGVSLIDGAYFFILPLVGNDYASQWRSPVRLSLDVEPGDGNILLGMETAQTFASNYELMFVRGVLNPLRTASFAMRGHEVTTYTTTSSALDLDGFNGLLERCILVTEDSLLPLPTRRYHVGENPVFWGIEGVQGYWFRPEAAMDPIVHIHELAHTFVGVYHSEMDDPWWKEGVTTYVAQLLALQIGMSADSVFAGYMLKVRDAIPAAMQHPLASPHVRDHLFRPLDSVFRSPNDPEGMLELVYGKGCQAAMILDRHILEGSGGRHSLFDLIRELIRKHGTGFRRSELVSVVDSLAGGPSEAFLSGLLDRATPLGADSLARTYSVLRSMGRLGPGGGKDAIAGLDVPGRERTGGSAKTGAGSFESQGGGVGKAPPGTKY